jgi:hypothetical protein
MHIESSLPLLYSGKYIPLPTANHDKKTGAAAATSPAEGHNY